VSAENIVWVLAKVSEFESGWGKVRENSRTQRNVSLSVCYNVVVLIDITTTITTTVLQPFLPNHLGVPVPEENFWTLCCKGR